MANESAVASIKANWKFPDPMANMIPPKRYPRIVGERRAIGKQGMAPHSGRTWKAPGSLRRRSRWRGRIFGRRHGEPPQRYWEAHRLCADLYLGPGLPFSRAGGSIC